MESSHCLSQNYCIDDYEEYSDYCPDCRDSEKFWCPCCLDSHKKQHPSHTRCFPFEIHKEKLLNFSFDLSDVKSEIYKISAERKGRVAEALAELKNIQDAKEVFERMKEIKTYLKKMMLKSVVASDSEKALEELYKGICEKEAEAEANAERYKTLEDAFIQKEGNKLFSAFLNYQEFLTLRSDLDERSKEKIVNSATEAAISCKDNALRARKVILEKIKKANEKYFEELKEIFTEYSEPVEKVEQEEQKEEIINTESVALSEQVFPEPSRVSSEFVQEPSDGSLSRPAEPSSVSIFKPTGFYYYLNQQRHLIYSYSFIIKAPKAIPVDLPAITKAESIVLYDTLIVCGGERAGACIPDTYSISVYPSTEITKLGNMLVGRTNHALAVVEDTIYAIGGQNKGNILKSVECLNDSNWIKGPDLPYQIEGAAACYIGKALYLFGGKMTKSAYSLAVHRLTLVGQGSGGRKWEPIAKLPKTGFNGITLAVPYQNKILILGGDLKQNCYSFDTFTKEITLEEKLKLKSKEVDFKRNSAIEVEGIIYLVSSRKQTLHVLANEDWYELQSQEWTGESMILSASSSVSPTTSP